jgi:anti-sigma B factor antagonist
VSTATKVKVDRVGEAGGRVVSVLRFSGDISSLSRDAVLGTWHQLPDDAKGRVLLDFSGVDYLNSSGIALVINMLMEARRGAHSVRLFGLRPHFQKMFRLVGITNYTELHPDEASALESFGAA